MRNGRNFYVGVAILATFGSTAEAVGAQPTTTGAGTPVATSEGAEQECEPPVGDEIVVCADRREPVGSFRIDPAILAVDRADDLNPRDSARARDEVNDQSCVPYGTNGCLGRDVIPVSAIALTALRSALLAAQGEDWREPLRTRLDGYRVYQDAKEKSRKPRVSVGMGLSKP